MKNRFARRAGPLLAMVAAGVLAWAAYAPVETCSDPACARERFRISVEVDSFRDVEPVALEADSSGRVVTPASIMEAGGIRVKVDFDQRDLPYEAASGPLTPADLSQYTEVWRGQKLPADAHAGLYAMLTPGLESESGERLFGVMFDLAGREGFAVAPAETARLFKDRSEDSIALLQLRTFTHELLHALNRQHLDAAQVDGRLTIEAATRCIATVEGEQWSLNEAPFMSISPKSIRYFQNAAARDVLPGAENAGFDLLRTSATECADARRNVGPPPALSRWQLMKRRLSGMTLVRAAHAQDRPLAQRDARKARVEIRIQAQDAPYPRGFPIAIRLMVTNSGTDALPLRGRLSPAYGIVQVERRALGDEVWIPFKPLILYEPESDSKAVVVSGERVEETAAIFYGSDGWTFPQPGGYEIRALLKVTEDQGDAISNILQLRIAAPDAEDDEAVLRTLLDEHGQLDDDVGRLLAVGGRIGSETDISSIAAISKSHGHTALGSTLRLLQASQLLSPPIDPRTGARPKPESTAARELLNETCADSGVAAYTYKLLERSPEAGPRGTRPVERNSASAWDGAPAEGAPFETYSDAALQRFGSSLHFCAGNSALSGPTRAGAIQLAKDLRRVQPQRIVLVGHSDRGGRCAHNDSLALQRAEAVKRALIHSGIAAERIRTVSLGPRRPLDFSASEAARMLNRRVEVLIDTEKVGRNLPAVPIYPRCGG